MYAHFLPRAAHDPIVNKSLRLDNWPGNLTTLWHAKFVHGRLSKPAPPRYDCHIRLFNELDEDCQGKTETSEEKIDRLSLSSSSTVVASGEFHASSSPILPKGEVPKDVLQVLKPVVTVAANFQKELEKSAKRAKGNVVEVKALVRNIRQYSHLLVFLLRVSEPKGTSTGISAFEVALYDNLEAALKDFAVISEALIKGLKMAVDLGEWSNRNGIHAQLHFAQMEWDFIEGVMKEILADARERTFADLILKGLASRGMTCEM